MKKKFRGGRFQVSLFNTILLNTLYIAPICIYLYIISNALNETDDAYSLQVELNPTLCRSVLQLVFFVVFLFIKTCK